MAARAVVYLHPAVGRSLEAHLKNLKAAIIVVVLAPILALAKEVPTTNPTAAPNPKPAAPAAAPTASTSASNSAAGALAAAEEKENQGGASLGVELDHALGTGTFVDPALYSYFGATLSVVPRYVFVAKDVKLAVSLALRGAWEYTLPDNENGRRFSPGDTRLGLSAPGLFKGGPTGISISPSIGILIPTTPESWQAGLITNLSVGLALSKNVGRFNFALTTNGSRGFHTTGASQVRSQAPGAADQLNSFAARKSALGQDEAFVGFAAWNTAWAFNIGGNVSAQVTDELSFVVGYTYSRSWKYYGVPIGTDERLGVGARYGSGESDRTSTVLAANYQLTDHYGISLSASTLQTPRSGANGEAGYFRFPFWAIGNAADNATSISFTFSASY
jgi:hypothetical protein